MANEENNVNDAAGMTDDELLEKVEVVINEIRPYLQGDGGDCELLKVEDRVAYVHLTGACHGCPHAMITLKNGIEARVRELVPEILAVESV